jgi:hypothetical protein
MGFLADAVKFVRSSVFKKELENGHYTVETAIKDGNGEEIDESFEIVKSAINKLIDAVGERTITKNGRGISSQMVDILGGYTCSFDITISADGNSVNNLRVDDYIGFSSEPRLSLSGNKIRVDGRSASSGELCEVTVKYEQKINYLEISGVVVNED